MRTVEFTHSFTPDSTAISNVWFDQGANELFIQFKGGARKCYRPVPFAIYERFKNAKSAGQFYNCEILRRFASSDASDVDFHPFREALTKGASKFIVEYVLIASQEVQADDLFQAVGKFKNLDIPHGATIEVRGVKKVD